MTERFKPSEAGKGDGRRSALVDKKIVDKNWDQIDWGDDNALEKKTHQQKQDPRKELPHT